MKELERLNRERENKEATFHPAPSSHNYDSPGLVWAGLSPSSDMSHTLSENSSVSNSHFLHRLPTNCCQPVPKSVLLETLNHSSDTKQIKMVVDTASPSTIIGKDTFPKLQETYPSAISR